MTSSLTRRQRGRPRAAHPATPAGSAVGFALVGTVRLLGLPLSGVGG